MSNNDARLVSDDPKIESWRYLPRHARETETRSNDDKCSTDQTKRINKRSTNKQLRSCSKFTPSNTTMTNEKNDTTGFTADMLRNDYPIVALINLSDRPANRVLPAALSAHIQQSQWTKFIEDAVRCLHRVDEEDGISKSRAFATICPIFCIVVIISGLGVIGVLGLLDPALVFFILLGVIIITMFCVMGIHTRNRNLRHDALDDRINEELCKPMNLAYPAFHFVAKNDLKFVDKEDGSAGDKTYLYTHYIVVAVNSEMPGGGEQNQADNHINSLLDDFMANGPSSSAAIPLEITTAGNADDDIEV
mmetsp:Transcript_26040/g.72671  ORF Transcript_26040/g.72671 Transcript_26040/m.72671 type:complete len:306 (+) Transcript_26040:317-1234(+)